MIYIKFCLSALQTLDMDLAVKNPNKVASSTPATSFLNYRGQLVCEAPLLADGETKAINITLTLMADHFISNSDVFSDLNVGIPALKTFWQIQNFGLFRH
jgi:hypothetical protein